MTDVVALSDRWQDWLRGIRKAKQLDGETDAEWTDRLVRDRMPGKRRQCSIGWHSECSDPDGDECTCPCHWYGLEYYIAAIIELEDENARLRVAVSKEGTE